MHDQETFDRITFSDARTRAEFDDWPSGKARVKCEFWVEKGAKHGERVARRTTHPKTGRWCAPKKTTYATRQRIVTGSNGRTYILRYIGIYQTITVIDHALASHLRSVREDDDPQTYVDLFHLLVPPAAA